MEWLAIAALAVALISGGVSIYSSNKTNKTLTENQEKQNIWNEEMVNKQNAYNTPTNQLNRMMQAGINPGMAFNSILDVPSIQQNPATSGSGAGAVMPDLTKLFDLGQSAKSFYDTYKSNKEGQWIDKMNGKQSELWSSQIKANIAKAHYDEETTKFLQDYVDMAKDLNTAQIEELRSKNNLNAAAVDQINAYIEFLGKQGEHLEKQNEVLDKDIEVKDAQIENLQAQTENFEASTDLYDAEKENVEQDTKVKQEEIKVKQAECIKLASEANLNNVVSILKNAETYKTAAEFRKALQESIRLDIKMQFEKIGWFPEESWLNNMCNQIFNANHIHNNNKINKNFWEDMDQILQSATQRIYDNSEKWHVGHNSNSAGQGSTYFMY